MALDIEFPTPEEEFQRYQNKLQGAPIKVDLPTEIDNAIGGVDLQTFEQPYNFPRQKPKETPGFFSTAFHTYKDWELIAHAADYGYHELKTRGIAQDLALQNPRQENTQKDWTPLKIENFIGIPDRYYSYIVTSESEDILEARQQEIARQIKDNEEFADGSIWAKILGGGAAMVTDAALLSFIPMANSLRYAKWGEDIFQSMIKTAPTVAIGSLAYTAGIDATTTGKTMEDFAIDAAINTLAGIALTGAAHGVGRLLRGGQMYEARNALRMNFEGIEAVQKVSPEGLDLGLVARAAPNSAANAMEVTRAQEFLDSRLAKRGLLAIPYVGTTIEKGVAKMSPIVRGLTSEWGPMRSLMNRMADHSIETGGIARGEAREQNFEIINRSYYAKGFMMGSEIDGAMNLANGIGGSGPIAASKRIAQRISDGRPDFNTDTWGHAVLTSRYSGIPSAISEVNDLNRGLDEYYSSILQANQKAHGFEEKDLPVKTAAAYINRGYNLDYMNTDLGMRNWEQMSMDFFRRGDRLITEATAPINELEDKIKTLEADILAGKNQDENRASLRVANNKLKNEKNILRDRIHDDQSLKNLLVGKHPLDREDEKLLRRLIKPWKEAQKTHKSSKTKLSAANKELTSLKKKYVTGEKTVGIKKSSTEQSERTIQSYPQAKKALDLMEQAASITPTPQKDYAKIKTKIDKLEKEVEALKKETERLEMEALDEHTKILDQIQEGNVRRTLYSIDEETGKISLYSPDIRPKFRPLFSDHGEFADAEMINHAKAIHSNITGTNPDKLAQQMMDTLMSGVTGNPLKERSFLIDDETLLSWGFLSTDLKRSAMRYALTVGKNTALTQSLKGLGVNHSGMRGFAEEMTKELEIKRNKISASNMSQEKKDKEFIRLAKSFKKTNQFGSDIVKVAMGTYAKTPENQTLRHSISALRSLTHATRLGSLPLLQIPDFVVGMYRNGPWKWARDGIFPMIKNMNGMIKTKGSESYRKASSVAGLSIEGVMHNKTEELFNYSTQVSQSWAGKTASVMSSVAKGANIASLSAFMEDTNQRLLANIAQSNLMESMYQFKAGTLGKKELRQLLNEGIQPERDADILIKAFESSPSSYAKKGGGYQSEYWEWQDYNARNLMTDNINKAVSKTLIRRGLFDSPLISHDPIISLLFTYTGWYFSALNRFIVPFMQRPTDAYLIGGTIASSLLGMMVDPLRSWSRGEEFDMDEEQWFFSSISAAPLLAPVYSAAMRANSILGIDFLNKIKNDRYRNLSVFGGIGGASLGVAESLANGARMFATGRWNEHDWKRLVNTMPAMQMWYMNDWKNQFMDSMTEGLPKNYASAQRE